MPNHTIVRVPARLALLISLMSLPACPGFGGNNSNGPTGPTSQYPYDGNYTGTWSASCPLCGVSSASGTFTTTIANGAFTDNTGFPITSGNFGPKLTSGSVSSGGPVSATGTTPPQCSSSIDTFTGQVVTNSSGGATMTMSYSRPASSGGCEAESGTVTATRTP